MGPGRGCGTPTDWPSGRPPLRSSVQPVPMGRLLDPPPPDTQKRKTPTPTPPPETCPPPSASDRISHSCRPALQAIRTRPPSESARARGPRARAPARTAPHDGSRRGGAQAGPRDMTPPHTVLGAPTYSHAMPEFGRNRARVGRFRATNETFWAKPSQQVGFQFLENIHPRFGHKRVVRNLAKFGRRRAKVGRRRARFREWPFWGQKWSIPVQRWSIPGQPPGVNPWQCWPNFGRARPKIGQNRALSGQNRSNSDPGWSRSAIVAPRVGLVWPGFGRNRRVSALFRPCSGQDWATFSRIRTELAQVGQTSACIPGICTALVPEQELNNAKRLD